MCAGSIRSLKWGLRNTQRRWKTLRGEVEPEELLVVALMDAVVPESTAFVDEHFERLLELFCGSKSTTSTESLASLLQSFRDSLRQGGHDARLASAAEKLLKWLFESAPEFPYVRESIVRSQAFAFEALKWLQDRETKNYRWMARYQDSAVSPKARWKRLRSGVIEADELRDQPWLRSLQSLAVARDARGYLELLRTRDGADLSLRFSSLLSLPMQLDLFDEFCKQLLVLPGQLRQLAYRVHRVLALQHADDERQKKMACRFSTALRRILRSRFDAVEPLMHFLSYYEHRRGQHSSLFHCFRDQTLLERLFRFSVRALARVSPDVVARSSTEEDGWRYQLRWIHEHLATAMSAFSKTNLSDEEALRLLDQEENWSRFHQRILDALDPSKFSEESRERVWAMLTGAFYRDAPDQRNESIVDEERVASVFRDKGRAFYEAVLNRPAKRLIGWGPTEEEGWAILDRQARSRLADIEGEESH